MSQSASNFKRQHHRDIAFVLASLDADLFQNFGCYFGGDTAIALLMGEYRESVDMDFLVSNTDGYKRLRQLVKGDGGLADLFKANRDSIQFGPLRVDQYGIRTQLVLRDAVLIKLEIVNEGRIELEEPRRKDAICGVKTLSRLDMAASKLLANSDRWADRGVYSRDLIDLAMLDLKRAELQAAITKSEGAYGVSITADLSKALDYLLGTNNRLEECMSAMKIELPKAVLWQQLTKLKNNHSRINR